MPSMDPTALPTTNARLVRAVLRSKWGPDAPRLLTPSMFENGSRQTPLPPIFMSEKEKRVPERTSCAVRRHGASRSDGSCSASKKGWIHFVGIGGSGLSAIALLAIRQGFDVTGSDIVWSSFMDGLKKAGVTLYVGHSASNIQQNNGSKPAAVVISSAIPADNVEVLHAKYSGIPVYKRDIWLQKITEPYTLIAISGTHGKSTTAGMLSYVMHAMGDSLIAVLGACVPQLPEENIISGCGPNFVLEADEYDGCFLGLTPNVAVVTNVEWDHVDYFKDEVSVLKIFKKFVSQIKKGGHLILCGDCAGAHALVNNSRQDGISDHESMPSSVLSNHGYQIITYGISNENEWRASSIIPNSRGGQDYILYHGERLMSEISLQLPGVHNVLNSLAVIATITALVNDSNKIHHTINYVRYHLNKFQGISRRFEMIGNVHGCCIYDDYAHHPTEVRAVLQAAWQRYPFHELWVVFQPHTFSRLAALMKDFAAVLSEADRVIVTEVYAAREANIWNVDGGDLSTLIIGPSSYYIPRMGDVIDKLVLEISSRSCQDIIVLTLGAGDITTLGPILHSRLRQMPAKLFDIRTEKAWGPDEMPIEVWGQGEATNRHFRN